MANFNAKWVLVSSENLLPVLKACGMGEGALQNSKGMEIPGDGGLKEEFKFGNNSLARVLYKPDGSVLSQGTLAVGNWTEATSMDGRKMTVRLTVQGDSEFLREEKGDGYECTWHRKVSGNEMTTTIKVKGLTCIRKYKKC